tara:strand:- start:191 stop:385 length:195 start_codon:yes stop_codon:yes gene_type:complete
MLAIPLIRTDDSEALTPIERSRITCDQIITALMMQGTMNDPKASQEEIDTFRTLSVATIIPAEA